MVLSFYLHLFMSGFYIFIDSLCCLQHFVEFSYIFELSKVLPDGDCWFYSIIIRNMLWSGYDLAPNIMQFSQQNLTSLVLRELNFNWTFTFLRGRVWGKWLDWFRSLWWIYNWIMVAFVRKFLSRHLFSLNLAMQCLGHMGILLEKYIIARYIITRS